MKNTTHYEWCIETLDNDCEIIDQDYQDKLDLITFPDSGNYSIVLVVNVGNEDEGLVDRDFAYVNGGKLSESFGDCGDKVPAKFHKELESFCKSDSNHIKILAAKY